MLPRNGYLITLVSCLSYLYPSQATAESMVGIAMGIELSPQRHCRLYRLDIPAESPSNGTLYYKCSLITGGDTGCS